jgi:hypothetical protein
MLKAGLRGMIQEEARAVDRAAAHASTRLFSEYATRIGPLTLQKLVLPDLKLLPEEEQHQLIARALSRALTEALEELLLPLAKALIQAVLEEARRLLPFAETLDVLVELEKPTPSLYTTLQAEITRLEHSSLQDQQLLVSGLKPLWKLPELIEALETNHSLNPKERLQESLKNLPETDVLKSQFSRQLQQLFASLVYLLDEHLDTLWPPQSP